MRNETDEAWLFAEEGASQLTRLAQALVILICLAMLFGCGTMVSTSACPQPSAPGELMAPVPGPIYLQPSTPPSATTPTMRRSATT